MPTYNLNRDATLAATAAFPRPAPQGAPRPWLPAGRAGGSGAGAGNNANANANNNGNGSSSLSGALSTSSGPADFKDLKEMAGEENEAGEEREGRSWGRKRSEKEKKEERRTTNDNDNNSGCYLFTHPLVPHPTTPQKKNRQDVQKVQGARGRGQEKR